MGCFAYGGGVFLTYGNTGAGTQGLMYADQVPHHYVPGPNLLSFLWDSFFIFNHPYVCVFM